MFICPYAVLSSVSIICSCCSVLIVGKSYIGPITAASPPPPTGVLFCIVVPLFFIIKHTMILVIIAVMSPVNRPVIGTAIATVCVCNRLDTLNVITNH